MSRDLTLGWSLALSGSVAGTLAAIGTFGDSAAVRYGGSTLASVAAVVGTFMVVRGTRTRNKKTLVSPDRAIGRADEVVRCYHERCRTSPGGRAQSIREEVRELRPVVRTESLGMRPSVPPPSLLGTWGGRATTITDKGRSSSQPVRFAVEPGRSSGAVVIVLEPGGAACRLDAIRAGVRATVTRDQRCSVRDRSGELQMTVRGGSIELRDDQLALELEVELVVRRRARVERVRSTVTALATRS